VWLQRRANFQAFSDGFSCLCCLGGCGDTNTTAERSATLVECATTVSLLLHARPHILRPATTVDQSTGCCNHLQINRSTNPVPAVQSLARYEPRPTTPSWSGSPLLTVTAHQYDETVAYSDYTKVKCSKKPANSALAAKIFEPVSIHQTMMGSSVRCIRKLFNSTV
jgi:hypothetical protein